MGDRASAGLLAQPGGDPLVGAATLVVSTAARREGAVHRWVDLDLDALPRLEEPVDGQEGPVPSMTQTIASCLDRFVTVTS